MTDNDVAFTARPVFVGWITILLQLPIQLFLTFWAGVTSSLPVFERGSWAPFLFFGGIAFFGIPAVAYFGKKLNTVALNIASSIMGLNSKKASFQSIKR